MTRCAGFFADKDADAKARGEDVKRKSKDEEFSDFMSSIAVDVREACFIHILELQLFRHRLQTQCPAYHSV